MARLTSAEVTHRLGHNPSDLTFLGQCYAPVEGHTRVCAITLRNPSACFTLKPKNGIGRVTVSPEAFIYFRHTNPDLYIKLQTGLSWLRLRTAEVDAAKVQQEQVNRLRAAQKQHHSALMKGKKRLQAYRRLVPQGDLPEALEVVTSLLAQVAPKVATDALACWYEQRTMQLEKVLLSSTAATLVPARIPPVKPTEEPAAPVTSSFLDPIPEIEF
jgi:hypothetical protein